MTRTTTRPRRLLAGLALAPLALGLVACGSDDDDAATPTETVTVTEEPSASSSPSSTPSEDGSTGSTGSTGDEAGLLAAAETALAEVDGTLTTVDRDDNGWDVTVVAADGTENDLDLSLDGATIERGPDSDDNDADDRADQQRLVQAAQLDYLAAIEAARGQSGGGTLVGVDLDDSDNRVEWDVDFASGNDETTVSVDAASGDVVGTENDTDDGDDDN